MSIQWTADLSVGVDSIDAQHKQLFKIVNDLLDAMRVGKGKGEVAKVLGFLESYVIEHFGAEERAMAQQQYPGYAGHKAEHEAFIKDFLNLKGQHEAGGPNIALVIEVNNRVCTWLRNHIAHTDKALGSFIASRHHSRASQPLARSGTGAPLEAPEP